MEDMDDRLQRAAVRIREAALRAADPGAAVERNLTCDGASLRIAGVPLAPRGALYVAAVGKAAPAMAEAAVRILGPRVAGGIVVMPHGYRTSLASDARFAVHSSGHPTPDAAGVEAARGLASLVDGMGEQDVCLFLLSGGGSSLLPLPRDPVTLADKARTTSLLLACGADIREINTVRKHISAVKGGQLAARTRGTLLTLVLSDVVGDPLEFIASGPTVGDSTTFADARAILQRRGVWDGAPQSVRRLIEDGVRGDAAETPKALPERHRTALIASNGIAVRAAMEEAGRQGFPALLLTTFLTGEAREAGRFFAAVAKEALHSGSPVRGPACLIAGGETTVSLRGRGRGGRNQEIALAAADALDGESGVLLCSFATDGKEGNSDAAGACVDGRTAGRGRDLGLDLHARLADNDSSGYFSKAGGLVVTGPTYTNVNDLTFALIG